MTEPRTARSNVSAALGNLNPLKPPGRQRTRNIIMYLERALRLLPPDPEPGQRATLDPVLEHGARRMVAEVRLLIHHRELDARHPLADAALDVRDLLDPSWEPLDDLEPERLEPRIIPRPKIEGP